LYHLLPFDVDTFVFYPDFGLESSADSDPHFVELWIRLRIQSTNPDPDLEMLNNKKIKWNVLKIVFLTWLGFFFSYDKNANLLFVQEGALESGSGSKLFWIAANL
jgi:hypothetical protein